MKQIGENIWWIRYLQVISYLEYQLQLKLEGHNPQWLQLIQQYIQNTKTVYLHQNRNYYKHEFGCGVSIMGSEIRWIFALNVTRFKGNFDVFQKMSTQKFVFKSYHFAMEILIEFCLWENFTIQLYILIRPGAN